MRVFIIALVVLVSVLLCEAHHGKDVNVLNKVVELSFRNLKLSEDCVKLLNVFPN